MTEAAIARCEECGKLIYDGDIDFYTDTEGNYFCCTDCALEYHEIVRGEDYVG